jgi:nitrile hydratase beta subunit
VNGVHDMGGMHGMGPIQDQVGEPVFPEPWEGRTFALTLAMAAWQEWTTDASRHQRELIPASEYLAMSYYEKWFAGLVELLVKSGLLTAAEVESGKPAPDSPRGTPPLTAEEVMSTIARGHPASRDLPLNARFQVGQLVRVRNLHPTGHTRLPRYARGKVGTIDRYHGVFVFPDTNAHFLGEKPQQVYSVRFAARELWGDQAAARDAVYIDMWDDYLEPA